MKCFTALVNRTSSVLLVFSFREFAAQKSQHSSSVAGIYFLKINNYFCVQRYEKC